MAIVIVVGWLVGVVLSRRSVRRAIRRFPSRILRRSKQGVGKRHRGKGRRGRCYSNLERNYELASTSRKWYARMPVGLAITQSSELLKQNDGGVSRPLSTGQGGGRSIGRFKSEGRLTEWKNGIRVFAIITEGFHRRIARCTEPGEV